MIRIFRFTAGIALILLGIAGLILPIMPGWILILAGLPLVSPGPSVRRLRVWEKHGIRAGFTTKRFQLFLKMTDDLLDETRQKLLKKKLPGQRFIFLNQVHGANVAVIDSQPKELFTRILEADGAITSVPGVTILVLSADCLSIFFRARGWVGLAHAGRQGTCSKIAVKTLDLICEKSGCRPEEVHVIFGPSICEKHYEVGPGCTFDVPGENRKQLLEAGARAQNIVGNKICTFTRSGEYYSFRREKESAGRMISFISISPGKS
ncbi:MAG: polyphenol oxidase family protein [Candidatus Omnitrophica bacterium]|nr:polyphenol oxidase family protein [Candidatus Omnitrophota bacterium]